MGGRGGDGLKGKERGEKVGVAGERKVESSKLEGAAKPRCREKLISQETFRVLTRGQ